MRRKSMFGEELLLKDYRIVFEKKGNMKYISHLDLNRCMVRAVRRSGLPAWYTEGFHPHLYLMFPLALSLGMESICETMDCRLTEEIPMQEIPEKLNAVFPDGLHAVRAGKPLKQAQDITHAAYLLTLQNQPDLLKKFQDFIRQPAILVQKRTKKGIQEINIRPMIQIQNISETDCTVCLHLLLPAGNHGSLNPSILADAFENYVNQPIFIKNICRIKIFCENLEEFL